MAIVIIMESVAVGVTESLGARKVTVCIVAVASAVPGPVMSKSPAVIPVPPTLNGIVIAVVRIPPPRVTVKFTSPTSSATEAGGEAPARVIATVMSSSSDSGAVASVSAGTLVKPGVLTAVRAMVTVSVASLKSSETAVTVMTPLAVLASLSASDALPGFTVSV